MKRRRLRWMRHLPQPRWLRRWYYRKSFDWWGHPSNGHWKAWALGGSRLPLGGGERDLYSGEYNSGQTEKGL